MNLWIKFFQPKYFPNPEMLKQESTDWEFMVVENGFLLKILFKP